jgi:D-amino-acid dehydrogenase
MRIAVVGAGLIGATTAYRLQRAGHDIVVLEREMQPARGASFANGGLLTPSMADPWNAPGVWRDLLRWMGRGDAPMLLHARAIPSLAGWGLRFLHASAPRRFERNTLRNLRLAAFSVSGMEALRRIEALDYAAGALGTLKIYRDARALEQAERGARGLAHPDVPVRALDVAELVALEPAVEAIAARLAGALHFPKDEFGDAQRFTTQIATAAEKRGAQFHYGVCVKRILTRRGRVSGVELDSDVLEADGVVVAAGSHSARLLRRCGVNLPVQPVKGYSITYTLDASVRPLKRPLVDDALHAAVTPLGSQLRVAGTAEFSGFDASLNPARLANLRALFAEILPEHAAKTSGGAEWAGLRPMSADGAPCIGVVGPSGLYVNSGHGHLGWTMADGSARLLTAIIDGAPPPLDPDDYSPARFL